jgi:hypothetical protein
VGRSFLQGWSGQVQSRSSSVAREPSAHVKGAQGVNAAHFPRAGFHRGSHGRERAAGFQVGCLVPHRTGFRLPGHTLTLFLHSAHRNETVLHQFCCPAADTEQKPACSDLASQRCDLVTLLPFPHPSSFLSEQSTQHSPCYFFPS